MPNLEYHTLVLPTGWDRHFEQIFDDSAWPDDPAYYLCAPSKTDDTVAPEGHSNLCALVPIVAGLEDTPEPREQIDDLEEQIEAKQLETADLEAEAEAIEVDDHEETPKLHRESNKLELRVERIEFDLESLNTEIADGEEAIEAREKLKTEREEVSERLAELRTRIECLETDAVDAFNEHMETVLDILEDENLNRIWIERRQTEVREGRRKVTETRFDLHIVRSAEDKTAYEDTTNHLSESEREASCSLSLDT